MKSIVETLESSISDFMNSEKYLKYLRVMSKFHGRWRAYIGHKGKQIFLGEFSSKEDAIRARKEGEKKYFTSVLEENQKS